ncbi:hypothetical protein RI367_005106 [Sorochytrium milnesiophthora]
MTGPEADKRSMPGNSVRISLPPPAKESSKSRQDAAAVVTPADVLSLQKPPKNFLVPYSQHPPVHFLEFCVKSLRSDQVFFEVRRPDADEVNMSPDDNGAGFDRLLKSAAVPAGVDPDTFRTVHYDFGKAFLNHSGMSTTLKFAVGPKEIKSFRMIERHYFQDKLLKSFDFTFGFCIPNSVNTWESIYEFPPLDPDQKQRMLSSPGLTTSDSFYFVDDELVMHNKATYEFTG